MLPEPLPIVDHDRQLNRSLTAVPATKPRSVNLHIDVALLTTAGLTPAGACLFAALSYLWFESVSDLATLAKLEKARGYKRFGPMIVTAEGLFPFTGLKKDGIAARIRELEQPSPCIWRGCPQEHPLITVRRLGQGLGLEIARYLCGSELPVERKRVSIKNVGKLKTEMEPPRFEALGQSPPVPPSESPRENAPPPPSAATTENAAITPSENADQNAAIPDPRTRHQRLPKHGDAVVENAALAPSVYGTYSTTKQNTAAAAAPAAAIKNLDDDKGRASLASAIRGLAVKTDPEPDDRDLAEVLERLLNATRRLHGPAAEDVLARAIDDPRVTRAKRPLAMLIRGIIGLDGSEGRGTFLLRTLPQENIGSNRFEDLPSDLQRRLITRPAGTQQPADTATGPSPASQDKPDPYPIGDRLAREDPERYQRRLLETLERLELPRRLGVAPSLDNLILAAAARRQLESDLTLEIGGNA